MEVMQVDAFEPDYTNRCVVCGGMPVVTAIKNGEVVYHGEMCGVCTWGEAAMLDPLNWNE